MKARIAAGIQDQVFTGMSGFRLFLLFIQKHGVHYITTPQVSDKEALVNIKTTIINESKENIKIKLVTKIFDKTLQAIAQTETMMMVEAGKNNVLRPGG